MMGNETLLRLIAWLVLLAGFPATAATGLVAQFVAADLMGIHIADATLPEALEQLWNEAERVTKVEGPELRVLHHDMRVGTRDYPFRTEEMRVTMTLRQVSVYDCLRHLGSVFGFSVDLQLEAVVVAESARRIELPRGSDGRLSAKEFEEVRLPQFIANGVTLEDGLTMLCAEALAVAGRAPPVFAIVRYGEGSRSSSNQKVTLDLRDVSALKCLSYLAEMAGYRCEVEGDRVEVHEVFSLHHPKHTAVFRLSDFARAMGRPEPEVTVETVLRWLEEKPMVRGVPGVNRTSGLVVVGWLSAEDEVVLMKRLGVLLWEVR